MREEIILLKGEFEDLVRRRLYGRQKSKVKWANISFFHYKLANGRRNKNLIDSLVSENWKILQGDNAVEDEIVSF